MTVAVVIKYFNIDVIKCEESWKSQVWQICYPHLSFVNAFNKELHLKFCRYEETISKDLKKNEMSLNDKEWNFVHSWQ